MKEKLTSGNNAHLNYFTLESYFRLLSHAFFSRSRQLCENQLSKYHLGFELCFLKIKLEQLRHKIWLRFSDALRSILLLKQRKTNDRTDWYFVFDKQEDGSARWLESRWRNKNQQYVSMLIKKIQCIQKSPKFDYLRICDLKKVEITKKIYLLFNLSEILKAFSYFSHKQSFRPFKKVLVSFYSQKISVSWKLSIAFLHFAASFRLLTCFSHYFIISWQHRYKRMCKLSLAPSVSGLNINEKNWMWKHVKKREIET